MTSPFVVVKFLKYPLLRDWLLRKIATDSQKWTEPNGVSSGISIYNTASRSKVPLILRRDKYVSWYMCGPTVYDSAHIGHACCYVKFDIIQRILTQFFGVNVFIVMGITDIDDKIITKAHALKENYRNVSQRYEKEFFQDLAKLNILPPSMTVRVTDSVPSIIKFIQKLFDKGLAYKARDGSVYFDTTLYKNYGKLHPVELAAISEDTEKKSLHDFALWKAAKPNEPFWSSPWGEGRPGWHIECSTIASDILGSEIDIHSGGIDLLFPHHENEEAQSCAYHDVHQWVHYWLHTGHLHLRGSEKMSKSLKNTISISDFLQSHTANQFRMLCLLSHYRNNIEYTDSSMQHAVATYGKIKSFLADCDACIKGKQNYCQINENEFLVELSRAKQDLLHALANDFDTPKAIGIIMNFISQTHKLLHSNEKYDDNWRSVSSIAYASSFVLNFIDKLGFQLSKQPNLDTVNVTAIADMIIDFRSHVRDLALSELKCNKNKESMLKLLQVCDELRNNLKHNGIEIKDHGSKSSWSKIM